MFTGPLFGRRSVSRENKPQDWAALSIHPKGHAGTKRHLRKSVGRSLSKDCHVILTYCIVNYCGQFYAIFQCDRPNGPNICARAEKCCSENFGKALF